MNNKVKVRRKRYVVDKSFQLRYAAMTIIFIIVVSIILVGTTYISMWSALIEGLEGTEASLVVDRLLIDINTILFSRMLPIIFAGMFAVGAIVILVVHRFAGPIYRLKRILVSIGEGNLPAPIKFRKKDEIHDLAIVVNKMLTRLKTMQTSNSQLLEETVFSLEKITKELHQNKPPSAEILGQVNELTKHIKEFKFLK